MINLMNKDDEVKEEIWVKAHKNSPFYEVSNLGRVRNSKTKRILKQFLDDEGYYKITLAKEKKAFRLNRLVYSSFKDFIFKDSQIHHKNGNRQNNNLDNLVEESKYRHKNIHNRIMRNRKSIDDLVNILNKERESTIKAFGHIYNCLEKYNLDEKDKTVIDGVEILMKQGINSIIREVEKNYGYNYFI